jgi:hypothetical protein
MLLLYSLTSYQRDPKSKKSFPWYLLRFTSSNGLPAVVFQASAEEQCLATLNIVVIAQWGSTEMICLDWCSTDDLCSPFIQRTSCRAKTVDHRLDTENHRAARVDQTMERCWRPLPKLRYAGAEGAASTAGLGSTRGISRETHVQQRWFTSRCLQIRPDYVRIPSFPRIYSSLLMAGSTFYYPVIYYVFS